MIHNDSLNELLHHVRELSVDTRRNARRWNVENVSEIFGRLKRSWELGEDNLLNCFEYEMEWLFRVAGHIKNVFTQNNLYQKKGAAAAGQTDIKLSQSKTAPFDVEFLINRS